MRTLRVYREAKCRQIHNDRRNAAVKACCNTQREPSLFRKQSTLRLETNEDSMSETFFKKYVGSPGWTSSNAPRG